MANLTVEETQDMCWALEECRLIVDCCVGLDATEAHRSTCASIRKIVARGLAGWTHSGRKDDPWVRRNGN